MTVVALDGPAGVGKSTVARRVAATLGVPYLDTGAMYRAVAWKALEIGVDPADGPAVERLIAGMDLELEVAGSASEVVVDGLRPGPQLRTPDVDRATSRIAVHPAVRSWLVSKQRTFARRVGAVMEGRDIGTVVVPETPHKFFLEAPIEVRAERRLKQLGPEWQGERERLLREMARRDELDSSRSAAPLRRDDTHELVDTSTRSAEQIAERIVRSVQSAPPR